MYVHRNNPRDAREELPANRSSLPQENLAPAKPAEPAGAADDRDNAGAAANEVRSDHGARVAGTDYGWAGLVRINRSTGLLAGLSLVVLGIWGAIVPFVGPYFGYGLGYTGPWYFTLGRLWLDVLPGIAVLLGGAVLAASHNRVLAWSGAWLALAGGIWFVVGSQISRLWTASGGTAAGTVTGLVGHQVAQYMGYFFGLGAVICVLAALGAGRLAVRGH